MSANSFILRQDQSMIDILWISVSFACGLLAVAGRVPPMIGYLVAGFVLHYFGIQSFPGLHELSDLGISLLLFSIGLKLDLKSLSKPEVLGVALGQGLLSFLLLGVLKVFILGSGDLVSISIVAFGLTFSSTVFVVKILEQRGDVATQYGRVAIGILIIQDILAVLFMAFSAQKIPSAWLLVLIIALWPLRIILSKILTRLRQEELIVLFGLTVALGGAYLFDLVNVKGDIGALVMGVLLSKHQRASEVNRWLMSFKNFFLLGFFLSIGMFGFPTWEQVKMALLISLFLPLRLGIYFFFTNLSRLRNRSSLLASSALTNFSEFGLIVCSFAVSKSLLDSSWLTTLSLVVSFSFVLSALLNRYAEKLYLRYSQKLERFQPKRLHPLEKDLELGNTETLIIGMGRIGKGAYKTFRAKKKGQPLAIEISSDVIKELTSNDIKALSGDATNPDFWQRVRFKKNSVNLILLAMPLVRQNCIAANLIRARGFKGTISSIAKFPSDEESLLKAGIDKVFNLYAEAGTGFANSACS